MYRSICNVHNYIYIHTLACVSCMLLLILLKCHMAACVSILHITIKINYISKLVNTNVFFIALIAIFFIIIKKMNKNNVVKTAKHDTNNKIVYICILIRTNVIIYFFPYPCAVLATQYDRVILSTNTFSITHPSDMNASTTKNKIHT